MKLTTLIAASAFLALASHSNAFTFDFNSVPVGTAVPFTINVPGYGDVEFSPVFGSVLEIGTQYETNGDPTKSLEFDPGDTVAVTFLGVEVFDVDFDFADVSSGEVQVVGGSSPNFELFLVSLPPGNPNANGSGLVEVSFKAVPEPAGSMLGVLGAGLLFLRRRREEAP